MDRLPIEFESSPDLKRRKAVRAAMMHTIWTLLSWFGVTLVTLAALILVRRLT